MKSGNELSYLNARQEYNDRCYDLAKLANNWRLISIVEAVSILVLIAGYVWLSLQQQVIPYAVELNGHSEVVRVTRADVAASPSVNQVKASLRTWVIGARTVYGDPLAQREHIDTTYAMTLPHSAAYQSLVEYHKAHQPFDRAKNESVEVTVNAVVPMPKSDKTWHVEWTETTRDVSGRLVGTTAWQGSFSITISPPTSDKQIMVNPMGVYVDQFAWTQRH